MHIEAGVMIAGLLAAQACDSASSAASLAAERGEAAAANAMKTPWAPRARSETVSADAGVERDASVQVRVDMPGQAGAAGSVRVGAAGGAPAVDAGAVDAGAVAAAGAGGAAGVAGAAGAAGAGDVDAAVPAAPVSCSRDVLLQRVQAYFDALAAGDPQTLPLHPNLYYTENGRRQTLGEGLWQSRPTAQFTRHALDTQQCGSVTEAVVSDRRGQQLILAVRLRYSEEQLIDVEAMVVRRDWKVFEPDAIAVTGADPWVTPVAADRRMSRDALVGVAEAFFQSIVLPEVAPPHAPDCMLRQNGAEVGGGNCSPGDAAERFEQLRYPVVDDTTGIVGAVGLGQNFLVMVLIKIEDGTLINIDSVGGYEATSSGW